MVVFEAGLMGKIGKQRETRVWGLGFNGRDAWSATHGL